MTLKKKPSENFVEKGENAGNQHVPLFPQCFLSFPQKNFTFTVKSGLSSERMLSVWNSLKFLFFGKELTLNNTKYCKLI